MVHEVISVPFKYQQGSVEVRLQTRPAAVCMWHSIQGCSSESGTNSVWMDQEKPEALVFDDIVGVPWEG